MSTVNNQSVALTPSITSNNSFTSPIHSPLKTENKIWGAILDFFGLAIKVKQFDGKITYVKIESLKEHLIIKHLNGASEADLKAARKDKIIHDLFLSTINPFKKVPVTSKMMNIFAQKVTESNLKYSSSDPKELYASLRFCMSNDKI